MEFKSPTPESEKTPAAQARADWDRIIIPAALAALLAVAITLAAVSLIRPRQTQALAQKNDVILKLQAILEATQLDANASTAQIQSLKEELASARQQNGALASMKYASLSGPAQPDARGNVFIDSSQKKWYFFTSGMKPAPADRTYELWLIAKDSKVRAGTFEVDPHGNAALLGTVPPLPNGAQIQLIVTDEPTGGVDTPTGSTQIAGIVK